MITLKKLGTPLAVFVLFAFISHDELGCQTNSITLKEHSIKVRRIHLSLLTSAIRYLSSSHLVVKYSATECFCDQMKETHSAASEVHLRYILKLAFQWGPADVLLAAINFPKYRPREIYIPEQFIQPFKCISPTSVHTISELSIFEE